MKRLLCTLVALAATPLWASEEICFPKIETENPQYIVGYGSLMETASKLRSSPTAGLSRPVRITGYQRAWNTRGDEIGFSTTYLGVVQDAEAEMVAAIYLDPNASDIEGTDVISEPRCQPVRKLAVGVV